MINKNREINDLLTSIKDEKLDGFSIVDFWDSDTTAIGLQINKVLVYISSYNYSMTKKYSIIIEHFDTGEVIEAEKSVSFSDTMAKIKELSKSDNKM
ncbi:hypothetical protein KRE40_11725 [Elizabethkingia meningoseptica]|uniref:Uncharacterized protein n=1 Tax=Elizabethkingia meningoseptica TaxID=238 RepID=A0A1V3U4X5_ELIME|nr:MULTISPECIES: hypothetical protein [Elizabethkingia]AQX11227.1 hypothetical protein BBD35_02020 [Elizabethkingia meningoseptica]MBG0512567.1 hypothetical protein [Elizabethkingia meningoseptica]MDE5435169.1 hypothetical protein [Elizabethkingia meningoseptica]MDE5439129.1 hypothetical protein [Elizabethkingia meningoseptica]MDE5450005.1 hypothetical protein [Elizabethkingia meningoseptica]